MSRIILKISGEALKEKDNIVSKNKLDLIISTVKILLNSGNKVAIVIGGGNLFRKKDSTGIDDLTIDTIGMLSTVINALFIHNELNLNNISNIVDTPFSFPNLIPNYSEEEILEKYNDNVIIFGGGIGKSGYTSDSGVILAANKIKADMIIKMTNVDGVYDKDPLKFNDAKKYDYISYNDVILNNLGVMDHYAIKEAEKKKIKIIVMPFKDALNINDYLNGEKGTLIE